MEAYEFFKKAVIKLVVFLLILIPISVLFLIAPKDIRAGFLAFGILVVLFMAILPAWI